MIRKLLARGERLSYGARALNKGGLQAIPKLSFAGGLLIGCDAGFMNYAKIKGSHAALKTGVLAAEEIASALASGSADDDLNTALAKRNYLLDLDARFAQSWLYQELHQSRNVAPAMHKLGMFFGAAFTFLDQNLFRGRLPFTLQDKAEDHKQLQTHKYSKEILYPKPDGEVSFDRLDSVFLSNTYHEEDQPCHLQLKCPEIATGQQLTDYRQAAQRYCPAGVYEVVAKGEGVELQINSQNCLHCKTCDIKDPQQNINWVCPEGGGGPNYSNM